MPPHLHLTSLGAPLLLTETGEQARFRTRKHFALLIRLAVEAGRKFPGDSLVDLLWSDAPPRRASHSLAQAISVLKAKMGREHVLVQKATVALADGVVDADVRRLDGRKVEIRGPFLDGFEVPGAASFEQWKDEWRGGGAECGAAAPWRGGGPRASGTALRGRDPDRPRARIQRAVRRLARGAAPHAADHRAHRRSGGRQDDPYECVSLDLSDGRGGRGSRAGVRRRAGAAVRGPGRAGKAARAAAGDRGRGPRGLGRADARVARDPPRVPGCPKASRLVGGRNAAALCGRVSQDGRSRGRGESTRPSGG